MIVVVVVIIVTINNSDDDDDNNNHNNKSRQKLRSEAHHFWRGSAWSPSLGLAWRGGKQHFCLSLQHAAEVNDLCTCGIFCMSVCLSHLII